MACNKVEDLIKLAKCDDYKVCVWGAGYVGTNYGYELLKQWGINIDFCLLYTSDAADDLLSV